MIIMNFTQKRNSRINNHMSLASHAGKDTFTINGKTVLKRSGTSNIYDITGGGGGGSGGTKFLARDGEITWVHGQGEEQSFDINELANNDTWSGYTYDPSHVVIVHGIDMPIIDAANWNSVTTQGYNFSPTYTGYIGMTREGIIHVTYSRSSDISFGIRVYEPSGSSSGGGSGVLAQGRVRDMTNSSTYTAEQTGFSGPPVWSSSGATGYNSSRYYFTWTFPGINEADHIIKVTNAGIGTGTAFSRFMGYTLGSDTITVIWNMSSDTNFAWQELEHYISVESSPF